MANAKRSAQAALDALGNPTRRAVFERVSARSSAVVDLAEGMSVSRSAVSQHLRVLKDAGLVTDLTDGTRRIYRIDPRGITAMRSWLDECWGAALESFKDFADREEDAG